MVVCEKKNLVIFRRLNSDWTIIKLFANQSELTELTDLSYSILSKVHRIRVILEWSENSLQWVSIRNKCFQAYGKTEAICLQNYIAEIHFIMDRSELRFNFYSWLRYSKISCYCILQNRWRVFHGAGACGKLDLYKWNHYLWLIHTARKRDRYREQDWAKGPAQNKTTGLGFFACHGPVWRFLYNTLEPIKAN